MSCDISVCTACKKMYYMIKKESKTTRPHVTTEGVIAGRQADS